MTIQTFYLTILIIVDSGQLYGFLFAQNIVKKSKPTQNIVKKSKPKDMQGIFVILLNSF